jgi:uncharacterized protein DUF2786
VSDVLNKVRKLLRLANSPNPNEAALAAAKAQQLIDEHKLSAALLVEETGVDGPDEPIENFARKDAPLDTGQKLDRWRIALAGAVSRANACRIYSMGGNIEIVGRPSDVETVRYLFGYLKSETNQLVERDGKGCGRTWRNNYRLGVVDTIQRKLWAEREKFKREATAAVSANTAALVRVNAALARIETKSKEVDTWVKANLKLYSNGRSSARYDGSAREQGRKAGHSIAINRSKGRLSA